MILRLNPNTNRLRWNYPTFLSSPVFLFTAELGKNKQTKWILSASECATIVFIPLTNAGCVIVWAVFPLSSQPCWGSCHQPCMSLAAFSQCVGADGMAASQAQLQHQICFLSIMPNNGKETSAVYMLSLLGRRLDEKWEMSHSLSSKLTHTWCSDCILMIITNDRDHGVHICCCVVCNGGGCRDTA